MDDITKIITQASYGLNILNANFNPDKSLARICFEEILKTAYKIQYTNKENNNIKENDNLEKITNLLETQIKLLKDIYRAI